MHNSEHEAIVLKHRELASAARFPEVGYLLLYNIYVAHYRVWCYNYVNVCMCVCVSIKIL